MGRLVVRIGAVLAVGLGTGLLGWGVMAGLIREPIQAPFHWDSALGTPGKIAGWGAGILAVGITTLILSFMEQDDDADDEWDDEDHR